MYDAEKLSSLFNTLYTNNKSHFTASPIRNFAPYVILLKDHKDRTLRTPIYNEKAFLLEIESILKSSCILKHSILLESYYVTKAPLHSENHYLLTLLLED